MKKSFKVLLLAVMALCLYVTAAAAANAEFVSSASFDIQLKLDLKTGLYNAADASNSNAVNVYYSSTDILWSMDVETGKESADFGTPEVAKKYSLTGYNATAELTEIKLSFDYYVTNVSFDISEVVPPKGASMSVYWKAKSAITTRSAVTTSAEVSATNHGEKQTVDLGKPEDGASFDILVDLNSDDKGRVLQFVVTLVQSGDEPVVVAEPFDSADIIVFADGEELETVTFTSTSPDATVEVTEDTAEVSFDLNSYDIVAVSQDGAKLTSADGIYSVDVSDFEAGNSVVIEIDFVSGDDTEGFKTTLTINIVESGVVVPKYALALASTDKFVFTGSNGVTDSFPASLDLFSLSSDLASIDAAKAVWGAMSYTVSSDQFSSFSITLDYPASASVSAVYYKETAAGTFEAGTDELDSAKKKLSPLEGYYKIVFSAGLVDEDGVAADDDGYFAFTLQVASVDAGKKDDTIKKVDNPDDAEYDSETGVIAGNQEINTRFLDSTGKVSTAIAKAFFDAATPRAAATRAQIEAALTTLGLTETDLGNATTGYKVVGITLPDDIKNALYAGMKFFVMISTETDGSGTNALGMGVLTQKQIGLNFFPIVFKLLKNPANTNEYMTFAQGNYYVGATNDMTSGDNSGTTNRASVVFVTADNKTFTIATDEEQFLRGQTATAGEPALPSEGETTDEVSSHGSSSGCDAGFGALALLAVAGALVARKVRK